MTLAAGIGVSVILLGAILCTGIAIFMAWYCRMWGGRIEAPVYVFAALAIFFWVVFAKLNKFGIAIYVA